MKLKLIIVLIIIFILSSIIKVYSLPSDKWENLENLENNENWMQNNSLVHYTKTRRPKPEPPENDNEENDDNDDDEDDCVGSCLGDLFIGIFCDDGDNGDEDTRIRREPENSPPPPPIHKPTPPPPPPRPKHRRKSSTISPSFGMRIIGITLLNSDLYDEYRPADFWQAYGLGVHCGVIFAEYIGIGLEWECSWSLGEGRWLYDDEWTEANGDRIETMDVPSNSWLTISPFLFVGKFYFGSDEVQGYVGMGMGRYYLKQSVDVEYRVYVNDILNNERTHTGTETMRLWRNGYRFVVGLEIRPDDTNIIIPIEMNFDFVNMPDNEQKSLTLDWVDTFNSMNMSLGVGMRFF